MYCTKCGNKMDVKSVLCTGCGDYTEKTSLFLSNNLVLCDALALIVPLFGLIFFLLKYESEPQTAKQVGLMALLGTATFVYFYVMYLIFMLTAISMWFI